MQGLIESTERKGESRNEPSLYQYIGPLAQQTNSVFIYGTKSPVVIPYFCQEEIYLCAIKTRVCYENTP